MIPAHSDIITYFKNWKRDRFFSSLKCDMKYIWESAWIYPTLFISTVIIYTECVFFHGYYFNNYTFPSNLEVALKAVISAYSSDLTFGYILVLYFIVAFGFWAIRLRKSIILEPFNEDAEKDRKQESLGGHLHALLAYELNHILKLYCDVDNKRPISTSINVVPSPSVNAKVEDVSEIMGTVATNNITFGPLQIPVKVLLSFFGRLLGGKKIQGSLFFSKNEIIIVASMMGGDKSHNWKVQRSYPPKSTEEIQKMSDQPGGWTAEGILIREMIEELACQIFSDLTEFQSFRWDATKAFMKGIESYRECLLSPGNKIGNLKEAESAFSHALSLDVTFSSAWYNLGAVYTELKFRDAAKVAFYKSFSNNRIKGDAYYALALNEYNTYIEDPLYGTPAAISDREKNISHLKDALFFCSHAESIRKESPEILLLKGRLHLELYYLTDSRYFPTLTGEDTTKNENPLEDAIEAFRRSVELSYRQWEKEESRNLRDQIIPKTKGTLTVEQMKHKEALRERLGEFGWAFLEYAAKEKHAAAEIRRSIKPDNEDDRLNKNSQAGIREQICKDALDASLSIFYEALFADPNLVQSPLTSFDVVQSRLTEAIINENLDKDVPDALLFWKCGILQICRGKYPEAELLLSKALVINPRSFLYQASHILGRIFYEGNNDPRQVKTYWSHALQHALNAYKHDKKDNDYQWGYIAEVGALIGILRYPDLWPSQIQPPVCSSDDRNRFTTLVQIYTSPQCGSFGTFLLTVFNIFEVLTLVGSKDFLNACYTLQEKPEIKVIIKEKNEILNLLKRKINESSGLYIQPLDKKFFGYLSDHENWILAQCYIAVSTELDVRGFYPEAKNVLDLAYSYLSEYRLEIGYRGINALVTKPLLQMHRNREAFTLAWKAHWIDPTSAFEHSFLGECESAIADYRNAIISWSEGIQRDPQHNTSISNIASANLQLSRDYPYDPDNPEKCQQNVYLQNAQDFLERSLTIAEYKFQTAEDKETKNSSLDALISIYFWMGYIHLERAEFPEAAGRFRTVKKLAVSREAIKDIELKSDDFDRLVPSVYYLGLTLFKHGNYSDAQNELQELLQIRQLSEIMTLLNKNNSLEFSDSCKLFLDKTCGKNLSIGKLKNRYLLIDILLLMARIDVERSCPWNDVEHWIDQVKTLIKKTSPDTNVIPCSLKRTEAPSEKKICADIAKINGLYNLKSSGGSKESLEKSIQFFRDSIYYAGDSESYVFLMIAYYYHYQLLEDTDKNDKKTALTNLKYCYQFLKKTGIPREYTEEYKQIGKELEKLSKPSSSGSAGG